MLKSSLSSVSGGCISKMDGAFGGGGGTPGGSGGGGGGWEDEDIDHAYEDSSICG